MLYCFRSHAAAYPDDSWDSEFGIPGAEGFISGLIGVGNVLYATGAFTNIGGVEASHIARFNGTNWQPLAEGISSPTDITVAALAFFRGSVYAGGVFQQAGTNSVTNIARWDGTNWFPCGAGVNGIVRAMTLADDRLIVGGTFTAAGGILATNIAAWDGTNWSPRGRGIPGTAVDSLSSTGAIIYAGGRFRIGAGINATNVARWNGTSWSGLAEGIRTSDQSTSGGIVRALLVTEKGLFAGGSNFRLAGKTNAINIARWDGSNWWALGDGVNSSGGVYALSLNGADLYVAGFFGSVGNGLLANAIARWDGTNWSALGSGLIYPPDPGSMRGLVSTGSELIVGGAFTAAGGKPATNIAVWRIPHALSVSCAEDNVILSWPATGTNFMLEARESVAGTNWSVVSTQPASVGDRCRVTNQINSPARFFRLRRK